MSLRWITAVIVRPAELFAESVQFWTQVTETHAAAPDQVDPAGLVELVPSAGDSCLNLQQVHGQPGVRLDLEFDDADEAVIAAASLGAVVSEGHAGTELRSPGGLQFRVGGWRGSAARPAVVTGTDGTTLLDQVCIDIGPAAYDAEVAFFHAVTGWDLHRGSLPEFSVLRSPARGPMRILLQRLEAEREASVHLDFACSDPTAARRRHEGLGAQYVARGLRWSVMRDSSGARYCLTERDPQTGLLPG
ncbi:MAG: VOC family protein [Actinomycetota bacterium]